MNILFVYFDKTIQNDNLYVKSLCEEIRRQNGSVECSIDAFWNSTRKYDIAHIQFPEVIFKWRQPSDNGLKVLRQRIARLKSMGTKIVYTRHDAIPHYCTDKNKLELYRIVETQSNAIIHLGEYSRQEFARIYPENTARHFVIPHHIYDSCGYAFPSKLTSAISWDYRPINSSFSLLGVTATKKSSALSSMLSSIYPCRISSYWLPVSTTIVLPTVKHPYKIYCDTELKKEIPARHE